MFQMRKKFIQLVNKLFEQLFGKRFMVVFLYPCLREVISGMKTKLNFLLIRKKMSMIIKPQPKNKNLKIKTFVGKSYYCKFWDWFHYHIPKKFICDFLWQRREFNIARNYRRITKQITGSMRMGFFMQSFYFGK